MNDKYAVGEYERRFLLDAVPADATDPRRISDHYLDGTRLRLRRVDAAGVEPVLKLGQKCRIDPDDPSAILHTTMYLEAAEFVLLAGLPGRPLVKTRHRVELGGGDGAAVDRFHGELEGLVTAEVDTGSAARLAAFDPPDWFGPEVTHDEAFTGGRLAGMTAVELAAHLTRSGVR